MRRGVLPVSLPSKARGRSPSLTTYYHASNGFADDTALVEGRARDQGDEFEAYDWRRMPAAFPRQST